MKMVIVLLLFAIVFFAGLIITGSIDRFISRYCSPDPDLCELEKSLRQGTEAPKEGPFSRRVVDLKHRKRSLGHHKDKHSKDLSA